MALTAYEKSVALDPGFAQAWARISRVCSLRYDLNPTPELGERARQAAEKAITLAPVAPEGYLALGTYYGAVLYDWRAALEQYDKAQRLAPHNSELLTAKGGAEASLARWSAAEEHLREADRLDPRSQDAKGLLIAILGYLRRYSEAREIADRGIALAPQDIVFIHVKVMTFLGEGNLLGARAVLKAAPREVERPALVVHLALFWDLAWVLDDEDRELLVRLAPSAFHDERGDWAICLAQAYAFKGDTAKSRIYAEEARQIFEKQLRATPLDAQHHALLGVVLAYLGRKEEAIAEGKRAISLTPLQKDSFGGGPYYQHQLVRIYTLVGEPEKALDHLEPLLRIPYWLSPGWLKIDPNLTRCAETRGSRGSSRTRSDSGGSVVLPAPSAGAENLIPIMS